MCARVCTRMTNKLLSHNNKILYIEGHVLPTKERQLFLQRGCSNCTQHNLIVLLYIVHSYWKLFGQMNGLALKLRLTPNFIWSPFVTISNKCIVVQWELKEDEMEVVGLWR